MTPEAFGIDDELTDDEANALITLRDVAESMHAGFSAAIGQTEGGLALEGRSFVVFSDRTHRWSKRRWYGMVLRVEDAEFIPVRFT